jgi:hypothetical protein
MARTDSNGIHATIGADGRCPKLGSLVTQIAHGLDESFVVKVVPDLVLNFAQTLSKR